MQLELSTHWLDQIPSVSAAQIPSAQRTVSMGTKLTHTPSTRTDYLRQTRYGVLDDRASIQAGDCVMLIIEDDPSFAKILMDVAREKGYKGLVGTRGDTGIALAHGFHPDAIALDINLPDIDGWTVLDRLKSDPATRHIPVVIVTIEEDKNRAIKRGAYSALTKPVDKETLLEVFGRVSDFKCREFSKLLVVEDDDRQREAVLTLIGNNDVHTTAVATLEEAVSAVRNERFNCIVLDLLLPGTSSFEALETLLLEEQVKDVPIIVYTGKDLTRDEEAHLTRMAHSVILKDVRSPERLLDETALFLHRSITKLPEAKQKMLEKLRDPAMVLAGKKALIVDDDSRNIFALTSVLERNRMLVMSADNGKSAIEMLERQPGIDVVLMDIMMPEMDGYETTRAIRDMPRFKTLPIIAVTAKAMKGDREKCIQAGASDYITKPVDSEQLLSLLQVWVHR